MDSSKKVGTAFLACVCLFFSLSMTGIGGMTGMLGSILCSQMAILIPVVICLFMRTEKKSEQLGFHKMHIVDILVVILYYVCVQNVLELASTISLLYSDNITTNRMVELAGKVPMVVGVLVIAVLPALCEELMFRGLMFSEFRKYSLPWAFLICSVSFGLLHGNLNQFTYTILAGVMLVSLVEATGSLVSSIIIHCIINLRSTLTVYALQNMIERGGESAATATRLLNETLTKDEIMARLPEAGVNAAIGIILGFCLIRFLAKRNNRWENLKAGFKPKKANNGMILVREGIFTTPFIAGVVLAVTYMVLTEMAIRGVF